MRDHKILAILVVALLSMNLIFIIVKTFRNARLAFFGPPMDCNEINYIHLHETVEVLVAIAVKLTRKEYKTHCSCHPSFDKRTFI